MRALFITMVILTGCARFWQNLDESLYYSMPSTDGWNQVCETWQGGTVVNLIRQWGPPTSVVDIPNGHKMYTWRNERQEVTDTYVTTQGTYTVEENPYGFGGDATIDGSSISRVSAGNVIVHHCTTSFEVNAEGTIVYWRWEGDDCLCVPQRPDDPYGLD